MPVSSAMRAVLRAVSTPDIELARYYRLIRWFHRLTVPRLRRPMHHIWDHEVRVDTHAIPVRIYRPYGKESFTSAFIFFHGGGWVTGDINSYDAICRTMAARTQRLVISVDYRLAPEHRFPAALTDCYHVTREIFLHGELLGIPQDRITLIGDSAGGNLAAAVSLMARDRGEFMPRRQILIYPACAADHTENSPHPSVLENGRDFLLTSKRVQAYMDLYASGPQDFENPYFAPLQSDDLSRQPDTLVITAELDPLRDEGEAYAKRLADAGNRTQTVRIPNMLHGYLSLGENFKCVKETYEIIMRFLSIRNNKESDL